MTAAAAAIAVATALALWATLAIARVIDKRAP
jgi:hypothetical protein